MISQFFRSIPKFVYVGDTCNSTSGYLLHISLADMCNLMGIDEYYSIIKCIKRNVA